MLDALTERNRAARELFAPLADTYDRYARLLSLGQDPRWRSFLVARIRARPDDTVLDVATGTGAVALELARRYGCAVVGVDQSEEMLDVARRRAATFTRDRVRFELARAEALPFADRSFDALTFTYLLRYVDDPGQTLRELARVVRAGGTVAGLDFGVPPRLLPRAAWELYVRVGLPVLGAAASPGWGAVGRFLGPSIRSFYAGHSEPGLLELWRGAGIEDVRLRRLSLGGGIVVWGRRAG